MTQRDLKSNVDVALSMNPAVQSASAAGDQGVDLKGYRSAMLVGIAGAIVGSGVFYFQAMECDTLGGSYTPVAAGDLDGAFLATTLVNSVQRVGYKGNKEFVRIDAVKTSGTSVQMAGLVVRGDPQQAPLA